LASTRSALTFHYLGALLLILWKPAHALEGKPDQCGLASVYSTLGEETVSGQDTSVNDRTAAHRSLPFGTLIRVDNQEDGRSAVVRITDRDPFVSGRIIDVSQIIAAHELGFSELAKVCLNILSIPENRPGGEYRLSRWMLRSGSTVGGDTGLDHDRTVRNQSSSRCSQCRGGGRARGGLSLRRSPSRPWTS
jgi:rare lipoprotein A (peptidoglycan hydrolase)